MDIFFINNLRFPTEKAHGYQIVKMCEALADLGHKVTLIHPTRANHLAETVFSYYHLRPNFTVKSIKTPDFFTWRLPSRAAYYLNSLAFYWRVRLLNLPKTAVIISRNPELLWSYGKRGYRSFYDAHKWPTRVSLILKRFLSLTTGVIANSVGTATEAKKYQLNNILIAPNGVDLNDFVNRESEVEAIKKKFDLSGKVVIAYAGHFYKWKGVDTLVKALALLPSEDFVCLLVGAGPKSDQKNILTIGQIPHREVAAHLLAADILVLPTAPISPEAERFTSPIKLFEYLAAGKAIIASDLPSSRAIISDQEARFFIAGDEHSLASVLQSLATDPVVRQSLGERGRRLALNYTWAVRASKVSAFLTT